MGAGESKDGGGESKARLEEAEDPDVFHRRWGTEEDEELPKSRRRHRLAEATKVRYARLSANADVEAQSEIDDRPEGEPVDESISRRRGAAVMLAATWGIVEEVNSRVESAIERIETESRCPDRLINIRGRVGFVQTHVLQVVRNWSVAVDRTIENGARRKLEALRRGESKGAASACALATHWEATEESAWMGACAMMEQEVEELMRTAPEWSGMMDGIIPEWYVDTLTEMRQPTGGRIEETRAATRVAAEEWPDLEDLHVGLEARLRGQSNEGLMLCLLGYAPGVGAIVEENLPYGVVWESASTEGAEPSDDEVERRV
jgi:hypothetical protein